MEVYRKKEVVPLLQREFTFHPMELRKEPKTFQDEQETNEVEEKFEEEILEMENRKWRGVSLVWQDAILLTLDFLQIFALIQSMALRWTYSSDWLAKAYFFFLFNLDVWEFTKLHKNIWIDLKSYYTPSTSVPLSYWYIAVGWFSVVAGLALLFVAFYAFLKVHQPRRLGNKLAWVRRIFFFLVQVLTLPLGTTIAHLCQCTDANRVDVMNEIVCFTGMHWLYVTFGIIIAVFLFVVFPVYIVFKVRRESVGSCSKHHESFLLLKESEYKIGLSKAWLYSDMYLYSSFRFWGIYHRVIIQIVKMILLIIYVATFKNIVTQAWTLAAFLAIFFVLFLFIRPYRLTSFNVMLVMSYLVLFGLTLIGAMKTEFNAYTLDNPWMTPSYSMWLVALCMGCWALIWIIFSIYLIFYKIRHCCNKTKLPLWPTFTSSDEDYISPEARKFLKTFLRARIVLDKTKESPQIFAQVHDLAQQIKVLNVYCREAEYLGDALHGIMWDLLDEMIDVHSDLSQKSLFAETVKESIRYTSQEFLKLMPSFTQRLAQRDYDLILVNPIKKRMLLKMYCMGIFLNGRKEKLAKAQMLTKPALDTIWQETDHRSDVEEGYYEDLYPDPLEIQSDSSVDLSLESADNDDDISFNRVYDQLPQVETLRTDFFRPVNSPRPGSASSASLHPGSASSMIRPGSGGSHSRSAASLQRPSSGTSAGSQGHSNPGFIPEEETLPGYIEATDDRPASRESVSVIDTKQADSGPEGNNVPDLLQAADAVIDMEASSPSHASPKKKKLKKRSLRNKTSGRRESNA
ncbi:uncharacterized protein LOC110461556 [Mizuhopecten yessoensis]|uniref:Uncharacterized protein n=1 Tax=Mizuhopecten yessoensis TaxID=6573 RepID=A0A210Q037_MIZYE|nr:uncharacterized protein LOC110461556 [Mizuhopecten yessoensis]OWF42111.1 hypothetical protein KP79_PYT09158 [Mizuhopecten yessoensis]